MDARGSRGVRIDGTGMGSGERGVPQSAQGAYGCSVSSVALTPDGRKGISGSLDNTVRIWDLESGVCLKVLEGHTEL